MAVAFDMVSFASGAMNVMGIVFGVLVGGGLIGGGLWWYFKEKKYKEFTCVVWDKENGEARDSAGIFVDGKTNNKRFFMKKFNVGLCPDNVPYKRLGAKKIVYLIRDGLKNFRFVKLNVSNPNMYMTVTEEDVNWAVNAYDRQKKLFQQSILMQMLPIISLVFVSMVILILFFYLFKKFDVITAVASELKETAKILVSKGTI